MTFLPIVAVFVLTLAHQGQSSGWNYDSSGGKHGPSEWKESFPACGKKSQSPIDIPRSKCSGKFKVKNLDKKLHLTVANNGHSVQANLAPKSDVTFDIDGRHFIVEQFHFHWGTDKKTGSEHTVNGKAYPLEMHIVAYEDKYMNVKDAMDKRGLAVLGILFKEKGDKDRLEAITDVIPSIKDGTKEVVRGFSLADAVGDVMDHGYYRYMGSLTTPPCYEGVVWTIFRKTLSVSKDGVSVFRKETGIHYNYRPTQPLNGREVKCM